jgi:hypothetical protein
VIGTSINLCLFVTPALRFNHNSELLAGGKNSDTIFLVHAN